MCVCGVELLKLYGWFGYGNGYIVRFYRALLLNIQIGIYIFPYEIELKNNMKLEKKRNVDVFVGEYNMNHMGMMEF